MDKETKHPDLLGNTFCDCHPGEYNKHRVSETKNSDSPKSVRTVTLSWVTNEGNSNTAEYHEGDKIELGTYRDGVQVTVYVGNING